MPSSSIDLAGLGIGAEALLATVLETAAQPVLVVDHDGVIRFANPAALTALGFDDLTGHECPLLRPSANGETITSELEWFVHRDGSRFPVSYVSAPLELRDGRGAVVTFTETPRESSRLADEQAALRRVATLVAQGVPAPELFGAVTTEVGRLLGADAAAMIRYGRDLMTAVGSWTAEGVEADTEVGRQWPLAGDSLAPQIAKTGKPARIDDWRDVAGPVGDYVRTELGLTSSVGSPILADGRVWGNLVVHSTSGRLPGDTEERLTGFTELVATAIANSEAQAEVQRLADEQAGLRRVATLVARKSRPEEVFAAVGEQVTRLLRVEHTSIMRYEDDGTATVVSRSLDAALRFGDRVSLDGDSVTARVFRTGRPARMDDYSQASDGLGAEMREAGIRSAVGAPIVVEGRPWGAIVAATRQEEPLPAALDSRIAEFTELVATAISNVQAWSDLAASRARIVAAVDAERRRVVRDLHDGAQQRLVHTLVTLKLARQALQSGEPDAPALVGESIVHAEHANDELRELSHGILPAVLTRGGLGAGVKELGVRTPVPVQIDISVGRLPAPIEATAYFVVAEALTNIAKHARARSAAVSARIEDGTLAVRVRDDGIGGARREGAGLLGLADRLAALDGTLRVEGPADGGTLITAAIPVPPPGEPPA